MKTWLPRGYENFAAQRYENFAGADRNLKGNIKSHAAIYT